MITGASQADAAILVVSASEGVMPQTKEHAWLTKTLGVSQIIVAINKMDEVNWDQAKFEERKKEVGELFKPLGVDPSTIPFVPIASFVTGENINKKAGEHMGWYTGKTVVENLDELKAPEKMTDKPLRFPVQDVYTITGVGTVPVGRVETGILKPNQKLIFQPAGVTGEVKSVEMHHEQMQQAEPGDNVGINMRGIAKNDVKRGDVAGTVDSPPTVAEEFTAQIIILQHPSAITVGYTPVFHCHTAQVACTFVELVKKINPATGEVVAENPDMLKTGDAAIVKLKPTRPFVVEKAADFPPLGRFAIRDMGSTVGAGMVIDIKAKA